MASITEEILKRKTYYTRFDNHKSYDLIRIIDCEIASKTAPSMTHSVRIHKATHITVVADGKSVTSSLLNPGTHRLDSLEFGGVPVVYFPPILAELVCLPVKIPGTELQGEGDMAWICYVIKRKNESHD